MIRLKFFIITTALLGLFTNVQAQSSDDKARSGSVYSNLGAGLPLDYVSSGAEGSGVPGVSYQEPYTSGYSNPAHWGNSNVTTASGGVSLQNYNATDNSSESINTVVTPNQLNLQIPLLRNRLGVSAGMNPVTRSNFRTFTNGTHYLGSGAEQDTLYSSIQNSGNGGINALELGVGFRLTDNIFLGYAGSLLFSSVENNLSAFFSDDDYQQVEYTQRTSGKGFGNRFGAHVRIPRLFGERDRLNLGGTFNLPANIDASRVQESNTGSDVITIEDRGDSELGSGNIRLPMTVSSGLTYEASPYVAFSTEGLYQPWSDFEYSFDREQEQLMDDRYKIGFGIRYFPFLFDSEQILSKLKYRLGVSYDTGHLKIEDQKIETLMFSLGLGFLSPNSNSSVDISFQYGIRGTTAENLVKENIWGMKLSLNLAELMFNRPRLQ